MPFSRSRLVLALLLAAGAGTPQHAAAQDAAPEASAAPADAAKLRYQEGAEAFAEGHFKDAIDLFSDAHRLTPNPAFSYNIGLSYEQLGDAPNALRHYRDYLRNVPEAPDREEVERRIAVAEARLADRGVQQLTLHSVPDGATVLIDGNPVGVTPWTGELVPGPHVISFRHRGYEDVAREVDLPREHAQDVFVEMAAVREPERASDAAASPRGPVPRTGRTTDEGGPGVTPITWAFLATGVVGLGAALGLELARAGAEDDAETARVALDAQDAHDRARTFETGARIALVVGGIGAIAGGTLLVLDFTGEESSSASMKPGVVAAAGCLPSVCNVAVRGRF